MVVMVMVSDDDDDEEEEEEGGEERRKEARGTVSSKRGPNTTGWLGKKKQNTNSDVTVRPRGRKCYSNSTKRREILQ